MVGSCAVRGMVGNVRHSEAIGTRVACVLGVVDVMGVTV